MPCIKLQLVKQRHAFENLCSFFNTCEHLVSHIHCYNFTFAFQFGFLLEL